jgi:hypothetical protein
MRPLMILKKSQVSGVVCSDSLYREFVTKHMILLGLYISHFLEERCSELRLYAHIADIYLVF